MVSIRKTSSVPSFLSQASFSPSVQFQTVPRVLVKAVKLTGDAAKPVTIQVGGGGGSFTWITSKKCSVCTTKPLKTLSLCLIFNAVVKP